MTLDVFRDVVIFCFANEANEVGEYLARNTKVHMLDVEDA